VDRAVTAWVEEALAAIEERGRTRRLVPVVPRSAVEVEVAGRRVRLFSSNDYLGLSRHPEVCEAAAAAARERGMGPRAASLVCGYTDEHEALEADLARLKGTEAALLFPTGFMANLAALGATAGRDATIFSDELNHASIVDGCRLARARVEVYRHGDVEHLESLLAASTARRKVVVTDTVFSMEGDLAPLAEIVALRERHDFLLVTDEAHATLVFGPRGGGVAEALGVAWGVDLHVGTLSKAVGALGGYVASSARVRDLVLNTARPYVFTTALPAPVVAAARAALAVARRDAAIRERLWDRAGELGRALGRDLASPIAPIRIGDEARALAASRALLERGLHVTAIRPPTVPPGGSRLRVTVSAAHTARDVADLAEALRELDQGESSEPLA
jgi:8-amino-7-oxononanoate synthase